MAADEPDPTFPFLTVARGEHLRTAVRRWFAGRGYEVTVYADHVVDAGGREFGLYNVAGACGAERDDTTWDGVIDGHFSALLRSAESLTPFAEQPAAELLADVRLQLVRTAGVDPHVTYGRWVSSGLSEVVAVQKAETIAHLTDVDVAVIGLDDLRRAGAANLRDVPIDHRQTVEAFGGRFESLMGNSAFTASLLLVLDDLLHRLDIDVNPRLGVLVGVPTWNDLALHVVHDRTAGASLAMLADFADHMHTGAKGAITPDVHWWRPKRIERVGRYVRDELQVEGKSELAGVFRTLGVPGGLRSGLPRPWKPG